MVLGRWKRKARDIEKRSMQTNFLTGVEAKCHLAIRSAGVLQAGTNCMCLGCLQADNYADWQLCIEVGKCAGSLLRM